VLYFREYHSLGLIHKNQFLKFYIAIRRIVIKIHSEFETVINPRDIRNYTRITFSVEFYCHLPPDEFTVFH